MKRIFCLLIVLELFVFSFCYAITISFNQTGFDVNLGDSFSADLVISGLGTGNSPSVGVFDINVGFDPTILNLTSVAFGSQLDLWGLGSIQETNQSDGVVNLFELSLDLPDDIDLLQADSFTLATLTFGGILAGQSSLEILTNYLGDSWGSSLSVDITSGAIANVNGAAPVPEPITILLFGTGLAGIGFIRRKRYL